MQEREYDAVIIGAGILGTASAYHLQKNNPSKKFLLIDGFPAVAQGNTARSNAMFRNTFTSVDNQVLSDASIDFYLDTENSGVDLGIKKTGYLWVMSERQLSANEKHVQKMEDNGIELRSYDRQGLEEALPSLRTRFDSSDEEAKLMKLEDVEGAVFGPKCGRLDPDKLSNFYAKQFASIGGKTVFNTNVKALLVEPGEPLGIEGEPFVWQDSQVRGVRLEGNYTGEIRSDAVVLAAGAWTNEILESVGLDAHVKAKKRQMFTISTRDNPALHDMVYNKSFNQLGIFPFVILPKSACYLKAVEERSEFWVACEDDFNREFLNIPERTLENCKAEPEYYERNVYPILKKFFLQFENARPSTMWAGFYAYNTVDSIPFVFSENGLIVAGGDSGSGIMKGDAIGRIVDALFREETEADLYGGRSHPCSRIGFKNRATQREEWVI